MLWQREKLDQFIPARDGTKISADLYFPESPGKYPALVLRTPYGKRSGKLEKEGRYFSSAGFVAVISDVRGRGLSEGNFIPYGTEGKDGYDVIEWAAKQEWCTGNVGTWGESYVASVQWLAALEKPPHLKAMISAVVPSDPFVENPTGVREVDHLSWLYMLSERDPANLKDQDWDKISRHLPLIDMDEETGKEVPGWKEAFDHTTLDDHLSKMCYQTRYNEIDLPVMHISGWYDEEQIGTPLNYEGMRKNAPTKKAIENQKLIMGPWQHNINEKSRLGKVDFGSNALIDLLKIQKRWFDKWLKDDDNGIDRESKVSIFVMGKNRWIEEKDWPVPGTDFTKFYLVSDGKANSVMGDGVLLSDGMGSTSGFDTYEYDPLDPVPSRPTDPSSGEGGPDDYSKLEERHDILVYSSPTLDSDLEITGPVSAELFISSDSEDTDFTVKLLDVWPTGFSQRLCDGIVRTRYRNGMEKEIPMIPGKIYRVAVGLWNTSHVFLPGHKIRVEVSSSAFPKYSRNQNVWEPLGRTAHTKKAIQRLYHDQPHPSCLILPVIKRN